MNQQERDVYERMMRQLPCDLVYIEAFIAKPEEREDFEVLRIPRM